MSDEKGNADVKKLIDLVRKHATHGKSAQAKRLLRNVGGLPRRFTKVVPKPDALKE